jgi:hypothetical protein
LPEDLAAARCDFSTDFLISPKLLETRSENSVMKVLLVNNQLQYGGAETVVHQLRSRIPNTRLLVPEARGLTAEVNLAQPADLEITFVGGNSSWAISRLKKGFCTRDLGYITDRKRMAQLYGESHIFSLLLRQRIFLVLYSKRRLPDVVSWQLRAAVWSSRSPTVRTAFLLRRFPARRFGGFSGSGVAPVRPNFYSRKKRAPNGDREVQRRRDDSRRICGYMRASCQLKKATEIDSC